jgi:hypothetical protein
MQTRSTFIALFSVLGIALAACANGAEGEGFGNDSQNPAGGNPNDPGGSNPEAQVPHALGSVVLGETHSSVDGLSSPVVSVSFIPDAKLAKACTRKVGTCEVTQVPKCTTGAVAGCGAGETCAFDDSCQPKCVKACTKACGSGEECFFGTGSSESGMECRKVTSFDAGAIAFDGTTDSLTMFPPYAVRPDGSGAPFLPGSEVRVIATGAKEAGFEKFDEKFKTTSLLETTPPLRKLNRAAVFGSGSIPISWAKGEDSVIVTVSGAGGVATCAADDKSGKFDLPREVVNAAIGDGTTATGALSISVTRERVEMRKDKKTVGSLPGQTVQPVGWLKLSTRSTETYSLQACTSGTSECGETCVNLQSDSKNCGACGKACNAGYYCSAGVCR